MISTGTLTIRGETLRYPLWAIKMFKLKIQSVCTVEIIETTFQNIFIYFDRCNLASINYDNFGSIVLLICRTFQKAGLLILS